MLTTEEVMMSLKNALHDLIVHQRLQRGSHAYQRHHL